MTVYLVGAGIGSADLLTVRAERLISDCEILIHDRLVSSDIISLASNSKKVNVGKLPGMSSKQDEINNLLIHYGREFKKVVRLKGGDPFVFGRGGEEVEVLRANGIDYEIVPGISASIAAALSAEIPLTHRDLSSGFAVISGQLSGPLDYDFSSLVNFGNTLVILMAAKYCENIAKELLAAGLDPKTKVAAISKAFSKQQNIDFFDLEELLCASLEPPATLVVGEVVTVAKNYKRKTGAVVLCQEENLTDLENDAGESLGHLDVIPVARTVWLVDDDEITSILTANKTKDFMLISSKSVATKLVSPKFRKYLTGMHFIAVGEKTAEILISGGYKVEFVAPDQNILSVANGFNRPGANIIHLCSALTPENQKDVFFENGLDLEQIALYTLEPLQLTELQLKKIETAKLIAFSAPSQLRRACELADLNREKLLIALGPTCKSEAEKLGFKNVEVAKERSLKNLLKITMERAL